MADREDEIVAILYEIGGRHRGERNPDGRLVLASELEEPDEGEPIPNATARAAYRARIEARRLRRERRGGGS